MKPSMPSILLCMLLSCLLASWSYAQSPLDISKLVKSITAAQANIPPSVAQPQANVAPNAVPPQANVTSNFSHKIGSLRVHPDTQKKPIYIEEPVVFEFIPEVDNVQFADIRIDTGETWKEDLSCGPCQSPCKEVRVVHRYAEEGAYNVVVRYQDVPVAEKKVIIVEQYLTDEELLYKVNKKIARTLKRGIQQVIAAEKSTAKNPKKFAFSSLRNANFEYDKEHPEDVEVIYSLMQAVTEQRNVDDHYVILERAPQALIRLAHESLYTEDPDDPKELKPYTKQEYGLKTEYKGEEKPFLYSIELSGVNDTLSAKMDLNDSDKVTGQESSPNEQSQTALESFIKKVALLKRPLMVAQFDTADFLVVIDRLEDTPVVTRSPEPGDYYDTKYDAKAIKRTATVKVNARIIDRDGKIMWTKNIAEQASDFLLPAFAPPTKQARKMKTSAEVPQSIAHSVAAAATRSNNAVETD